MFMNYMLCYCESSFFPVVDHRNATSRPWSSTLAGASTVSPTKNGTHLSGYLGTWGCCSTLAWEPFWSPSSVCSRFLFVCSPDFLSLFHNTPTNSGEGTFLLFPRRVCWIYLLVFLALFSYSQKTQRALHFL